jgi:hypothetical protein
MPELVTFDGAAKLIICEPGVTEIDVEADVYSAWKRWMTLSDNAKWPIAMRTVGGDPLSDTKDLGATFFLLNDWRIRPQEADHWLTVNGNLYTDPSGFSPFVSTLGAWTVTISMAVSNLSDASVIEVDPGVAADALFDDENIEVGMTFRQAMRLIAAAVGGKVSGAATSTVTFRSAVADDVDRIVAEVDGAGNRTAISTALD